MALALPILKQYQVRVLPPPVGTGAAAGVFSCTPCLHLGEKTELPTLPNNSTNLPSSTTPTLTTNITSQPITKPTTNNKTNNVTTNNNQQESTDGSWIEAKESGLVWHYRDADPDFGNWQAKELMDHLEDVLSNVPVEVRCWGGGRLFFRACVLVRRGWVLRDVRRQTTKARKHHETNKQNKTNQPNKQ
jgi:hypothetical protein